MNHEKQGTAYNPGACGHELQGRDVADASEVLYTLEDAGGPRYHYRAWEVGKACYRNTDLGEQFQDGTVIDGLCDGERNVLLIITRHEEEQTPWNTPS